MLRRCQFLLVSLAVCMASVLPSFAWSEESFVGKENLPVVDMVSLYDESEVISDIKEPVMKSPMIMATSPSSAFQDPGLLVYDVHDLIYLMSVPPSAAVECEVTGGDVTIGGVYIPEYTSWVTYPLDGSSPITLFGEGSGYSYYHFLTPSFSVPSQVTTHSSSGLLDVTRIAGIVYPAADGTYYPDLSFGFESFLDLSSMGEFSSFSLSGRMQVYQCFYVPGQMSNYIGCTLDLYVNDAFVRSFDIDSFNWIDFGSFSYDVSTKIESIRFVFTPVANMTVPYTSESRSVALSISKSSTVEMTVLSEDIGKPSGMDSADSALDDYQKQEGAYFEDANSAVRDLDTNIPAGMSDSAAMIGGMFNDLWYVLGDFSLIYLIPLLFSFFLWIVGRKRGSSG